MLTQISNSALFPSRGQDQKLSLSIRACENGFIVQGNFGSEFIFLTLDEALNFIKEAHTK